MKTPDKAAEIKAGAAAVIAFGTALFGWVGWLIILWLAATALDYLTGTFAALSRGKWSSSVARSINALMIIRFSTTGGVEEK